MENTYGQLPRFDMIYEEFEAHCIETWKDENYFFLHIGSYKVKKEGKPCFCNESKSTFFDCISETISV